MTINASAVPWLRLGIGLIQGLALLILYQAADDKTWPATDGLVFGPLVTVAAAIPLLVISGLGNIRPRGLIIWAVIATIGCVGFGIYGIVSNPVVAQYSSAPIPRIVPTEMTLFSIATILFIVHGFIVAAEADRRWLASYPTCFDVCCKHAVQAGLAAAFVGAFWTLLFLSAELFRLIGIEFLAKLIQRGAFWIPTTALAFSYGIHVTDVHVAIVRGTRTLGLFLLSWLLPMMALIGAAFVLALPFTGLEPLWRTRSASGILLGAAAALILLINAAFQDGRAENRGVAVLRYVSVLAAVVVVPLIVLAGYALALRIGQYGLTPDRVGVAVCVVVGACFGVGYVIAAARSGALLQGIEGTNVITVLVVVGLLLVLNSPIADPNRISVADQVSRLQSGRISPDEFDFAFLRFGSGRYGTSALEQLATHAQGPQAAVIAERAAKALHATMLSQVSSPPQGGPAKQHISARQRADNITVIAPAGTTLPESFLQQDWSALQRPWLLPQCLAALAKCEAIVTDLDGDGRPEILLFSVPGGAAAAFKANAAENWEFVGTIANAACPGVRDALRVGHFEIAPPAFKEVEANGQRLRIENAQCAPPQSGSSR
jgi:hypothetical protein